jgi:hypothetical protein
LCGCCGCCCCCSCCCCWGPLGLLSSNCCFVALEQVSAMAVVLGLVGCACVSGLLSWGTAVVVCCMSGHCGRGIKTLPTPPPRYHPTPLHSTLPHPPEYHPASRHSECSAIHRQAATQGRGENPGPNPNPNPISTGARCGRPWQDRVRQWWVLASAATCGWILSSRSCFHPTLVTTTHSPQHGCLPSPACSDVLPCSVYVLLDQLEPTAAGRTMAMTTLMFSLTALTMRTMPMTTQSW